MRQLRLRLSLHALWQHPVRSALALAACAAGVAGVLVLTAVAEGARDAVVERIGGLGRNMIVVSLRRDISDVRRLRVALRSEDAAAILAGTPAVARAAPAVDRGSVARFGRLDTRVNVVGTTSDWRVIRRFPLAAGRFFTDSEDEGHARVAVIGDVVRRNLFGDSVPPVGRLIRVGRVPLLIVGVLESVGLSVAGSSTEDDWILVPLSTAQRRLFNEDDIDRIYIAAAHPDDMAGAQSDADAILRARHPDGLDIVVQNQQALLDTELAAQAPLRRLVSLLRILALTAAAVGILAIMLLAVRERRNEIGLRIAVGARRTDIVRQFLIEALLLSGTGGAIGIAIGAAAVRAVTLLTSWPAALSPNVLLTAVAATLLAGAAAGALPAARAAGLDPADALRPD